MHRQHVDDVGPVVASLVAAAEQVRGDRVTVGLAVGQEAAKLDRSVGHGPRAASYVPMTAFETMSYRGQLGRLRRLAAVALDAYAIQSARLVPLAHEENTTFRVETSGGDRYVLRIHRVTGSPIHPPRSIAEVRSEMIWLSALRRDIGAAVPEPLPTRDRSMVIVAEVAGVPEPRACVLFRWEPGRFLDAGLTPQHLERVGGFIARLHDHAARFVPPDDFDRWRVGHISEEAAAHAEGEIGEHVGPGSVAIVERVIHLVRQAQAEIGTGRDVFGLIHGDLHQENFFFHRGRVRAIDFDDCGWGWFAYDLAVTLSEVRGRRDYDALRAGLLRGYRAVRLLPPDADRYIEVFHGLRILQLTLWILEQRDHPAFTDWEAAVRDGLSELEKLERDLIQNSR
jgi:Ser/Thr protein kinase RdoA (MazF antagonist)